MARDGSPAFYLPLVFARQAPAQVIAAVPLEPAVRVIAVDPTVFLPNFKRLAGVNAEIIVLVFLLSPSKITHTLHCLPIITKITISGRDRYGVTTKAKV